MSRSSQSHICAEGLDANLRHILVIQHLCRIHQFVVQQNEGIAVGILRESLRLICAAELQRAVSAIDFRPFNRRFHYLSICRS